MSASMTTLPPLELFVRDETVTIPLPITPPVVRGSVMACLARSKTGLAIMPALERTLVWPRDGAVPPLTLFARDLKAALPRGGSVWLVVRYGGVVVASGQVQVIA